MSASRATRGRAVAPARWAGVLALALCAGCAGDVETLPLLVSAPPLPASGRVVDLSQPGGADDLLLAAGQAPAPDEPLPTRVRAPSFLVAGGRSVDAIDCGDLIGPAVIVDLRERVAADPDAALAVEDLLEFEKTHGPIPGGAFVLLCSGWDQYHAEPAHYVNLGLDGDWHFPGCTPEAIEFLVRERDIRAVGADTPSVSQGLDASRQALGILLEAGEYAIENLRGLERLPARGATLVVAPLLQAGAPSAPARVLAVLPRSTL